MIKLEDNTKIDTVVFMEGICVKIKMSNTVEVIEWIYRKFCHVIINEENKIIPIEQAKQRVDFEDVIIQGVITKIISNQMFFIEYNTGSITLFGVIRDWEIGDEILVKGIKSTYLGLHEIKDFSVTLIQKGSDITSPIEFDLSWTLDKMKQIQGTRVSLEWCKVIDVKEDSYGNILFTCQHPNIPFLIYGKYNSRLPNSIKDAEILKCLINQKIKI